MFELWAVGKATEHVSHRRRIIDTIYSIPNNDESKQLKFKILNALRKKKKRKRKKRTAFVVESVNLLDNNLPMMTWMQLHMLFI
jgi:hypothetical protein